MERRISLEDALKRTKDLFELAGIKEEVVSNEIMKQVKEILSIGQIDDNVVGDSFVINNNKTFVEMYMDLIDRMIRKAAEDSREWLIELVKNKSLKMDSVNRFLFFLKFKFWWLE